jgi:hypothetical protein
VRFRALGRGPGMLSGAAAKNTVWFHRLNVHALGLPLSFRSRYVQESAHCQSW